MKAIFISYNQAFGDEIIETLELEGQRGFTQWTDIQGRGGVDGEPHYGDHAWPTMNYAMLTFVPDEKADRIMQRLRKVDETTPMLGLRAFCWNVEQSI
jgi:hypothetical protein